MAGEPYPDGKYTVSSSTVTKYLSQSASKEEGLTHSFWGFNPRCLTLLVWVHSGTVYEEGLTVCEEGLTWHRNLVDLMVVRIRQKGPWSQYLPEGHVLVSVNYHLDRVESHLGVKPLGVPMGVVLFLDDLSWFRPIIIAAGTNPGKVVLSHVKMEQVEPQQACVQRSLLLLVDTSDQPW